MSEPGSLAAPSHDNATIDVVSLPQSRQSHAVEVLTAAFLEDPLYRALIPGAEDRQRSLQALWSALITTSRRYGVIDSTPEVAGLACWLAPGNADLGLWPTLRTGLALPLAMLRFPADSRKKFLEMVSATDRIRRQQMPHPHWYLWALGVLPHRQGQGIGGALLAHGLARADRQARPCYLETETESNVAFYARRGFAVLGEVEVSGMRIWSMLRPSAGSSNSG